MSMYIHTVCVTPTMKLLGVTTYQWRPRIRAASLTGYECAEAEKILKISVTSHNGHEAAITEYSVLFGVECAQKVIIDSNNRLILQG